MSREDTSTYDNAVNAANIMNKNDMKKAIVLVQRELDNFELRLGEGRAFGKEVFLGMREFWITISRKCVGRPIWQRPPIRQSFTPRRLSLVRLWRTSVSPGNGIAIISLTPEHSCILPNCRLV